MSAQKVTQKTPHHKVCLALAAQKASKTKKKTYSSLRYKVKNPSDSLKSICLSRKTNNNVYQQIHRG